MSEEYVNRTELLVGSKRVVVLSLPHVNIESVASLQGEIIESQAQTVYVELDSQRMEWLADRTKWESLNLMDMVRQRQMSMLSAHLSVRILQKRLGSYDGYHPGDEMWAAIEAAREAGSSVELADRDVLITGLRTWRNSSYVQRPVLGLRLAVGSFKKTRARAIEGGRRSSSARLEHLAKSYPVVKQCLIDERAALYARRVVEGEEHHAVAVVADHLHDELVAQLQGHGANVDVASLLDVPTKCWLARAMPWILSAAMLIALAAGFYYGDADTMHDALVIWLGVNGAVTAAAVFAAGAHPWAALAAAVSSPFVSLNPLLAAGFIGGIVQLIVAPPDMRDIEYLGDDIARLSGWWKNRLARIVLICVSGNLGSTLGTFIAFGWFSVM